MLLEEDGEGSSPRERGIEERFLSMHGMPTDLGNDIHVLFKESVMDALAKVLGQSGACTLVKLMDNADFDDPLLMFAELDSIFHNGSGIIKEAIMDEFRYNVAELLDKATRRFDRSRQAVQRLKRRGAVSGGGEEEVSHS